MISFKYDCIGRCFEKKVVVNKITDSHIYYLYRGYLQIAELDLMHPEAMLVKSYWWDPNEPLTTRLLMMKCWKENMAAKKEHFYYLYDSLKNVTSIFGEQKERKALYEYSSFGQVLKSEGDIFYIDKEMSVYRRDAVGSWSAKMQNRDYRKQMSEMFCNSLTAYNSYTNYKYDEMILQDIIKSQFDYLRLTNQIFLMRQSKFSKLYNQLSWRQKMTYLILHFFPILENLYKFVHKEE